MAYETLIDCQTLAHHVENPDWRIFDYRSSLVDHNAGRKAYQKGHIPHAIFCDMETDLSSPVTETSGRHPLPDFDLFSKKLGDWGINEQTQVVAYDDVGGAFAVRLWWQLRTLGHNNVAILDGDITQWIKQGKPLSTAITKPQPGTFKAVVEYGSWLETEQIEKNLQAQSFIVLDARTPERFRGESEPIDTVAGSIPNSINRPFQLNLDKEGLFLPAEKLQHHFADIIKQAPKNKAENIIHLCGSGVTACHNMLAMEIAGLSGSKLYAGSWSEWIRDKNRPIATGS